MLDALQIDSVQSPQDPAHKSKTTQFKFVPNVVYVQFFEKDGKPASWQQPEVPGRPYTPVKKIHVVWKVGGNGDQRVRRFQIPLVPGLSSDAPRRP